MKPRQLKSRTYYWFWGLATFAVVSGQFYVGSGYRKMSKSLDAWFDTTISIMIKNKLNKLRDSYIPYDPITGTQPSEKFL